MVNYYNYIYYYKQFVYYLQRVHNYHLVHMMSEPWLPPPPMLQTQLLLWPFCPVSPPGYGSPTSDHCRRGMFKIVVSTFNVAILTAIIFINSFP